jgi:exodeoxyribonuclease VII large subunit
MSRQFQKNYYGKALKFHMEKTRIFQVSELTQLIKQLLESNVPLLWVCGEISNLVKATSGHFYFSLKDDQAQVRCVMFRHKNYLTEQPLMNGQKVEVLALATMYEPRGDFQLTVQQVQSVGLGALYEQFERLKQKLEKEGLFAAQRKRLLPVFPQCVGIVTSPQAAALRDVLATLAMRMPGVRVVLYPTPVQGSGSAEKIAHAIRVANRRAECNVLIVCRGGGSLEDLWAFNEEIVVRAIAASAIPIVSGVGHETDFTIADFVADERAPTPTAAAQLVVPDREALLQVLNDRAQSLQRAQRNRIQNAMQTTDYLQRRLVHPAQQLRRQALQLDQLRQRLLRTFAYSVQQQHWRWQTLTQRLAKAMHNAHVQQTVRVTNLAQHLALLSPQQVLARGYSLVRDMNGHVVTYSGLLQVGAELDIAFARGTARAVVRNTG